MSNYFSRSGNVLTSGRDSSGMENYAYSSYVPGFSMAGSQPFSFLVTLCFRSVTQGTIFRQEGVFELSLVNEELTFNAPGICNFTVPKRSVTFVPGAWYTLGVVFDGEQVHFYADGFLSTRPKCSIAAVTESEADYEIGHGLEAYFREVILYPFALTNEEVHASYMNAPAQSGNCAAWFDFSGVEIAERAGTGATISVKGFASLVNLTEVLSAEAGLVHFLPFDVYHPDAEGYTWLTKFYPLRTGNDTMYLAANSDTDRTCGWALYLKKESDDIFRPYLQMGGSKGPLLVSDRTVETFRWTDVAWVYEGTTVALYVDGELAGTAADIAPETLKGDGRTTFCGVRCHGKTDSKSYYSGYIAHISEFQRAVDVESLKGYMANQPYVLDEGIVCVFDFTDENTTEKCTLEPFFLSGQTVIKWVENTNQLTDPQQTAFYMPEQDNSYWDNLSDQLKWETKLFGDIFNGYLCDVMGYQMDEASKLWYQPSAKYIVENLLPMPEFQQIVKQGPNVTEKDLGALMGAVGASGMLMLLGEIVERAAKGASRFIGRKFWYALAALTVIAGIMVGIIKLLEAVRDAVVNDMNDQPDDGHLGYMSIEFSHGSNSLTGGIHIRQNRENPVEPPEWVNGRNNQNNPALCTYIVPIQGNELRIVIRFQLNLEDIGDNVTIRLRGTEAEGGILGDVISDAIDIIPGVENVLHIPLNNHQLNANNNFPTQANQSMWRWTYTIVQAEGVENLEEAVFITNSHHKVYKLLGNPSVPWRFAPNTGYDNQINYPWTEAMDVAVAMYRRGANFVDDGDLKKYLAAGLYYNGHFSYNEIRHYMNAEMIFNIDEFHRDFRDLEHNHMLNSEDCATILATYANLYGRNLILICIMGQGEAFLHTNIQIIGYIGWFPHDDQNASEFAYHWVTCLSQPFILNNPTVTDACLMLDMGQSPHDMNDMEHKEAGFGIDMPFLENGVPGSPAINEDLPYNGNSYRDRLVPNHVNCWPMEVRVMWILPQNHQNQLEQDEAVVRVASRYGIPLASVESPSGAYLPTFVPETEVLQPLWQDILAPWLVRYTFVYKDAQIGINSIVSSNLGDTNYKLALCLSGVNATAEDTADKGIRLGDRAFFLSRQGLYHYVVFARRNIVLQLTCNTDKYVDLLPLALELDRQILSQSVPTEV